MESKRQDEQMADVTDNKYYIPSTEPGFTGGPENWFDGKHY